MSYRTIETTFEDRVARVALNRPEVRNAFDDVMIGELIEVIDRVEKDDTHRVLVLTGKGTAFCSGADIQWMQRMKGLSRDENVRDALRLAELMYRLYHLPKPTVLAVNGASIGGSNGLVAACDIAIASHRAEFGLSEVKIGLVPACIAPYLLKRIGEGNCRRLFLTGERISAGDARSIGLVSEVVTHGKLSRRVDEVVGLLKSSGPRALGVSKELIRRLPGMALEEAKDYTARMIADLRSGEEAREGMAAFLEKRRPAWNEI